MTYRESPPSPRLHGLVAAYWGVDSEVDGELAAQRILPDGCADLICDFACASPHMRWVGTMTCAIEVQACGRQDLFGIRFVPGGLFPLLGAPLSLPSSAAVLADEMGVGMRTLQRRFMEHVGVSPRQHLRWLRFERARQLLLQRKHRSVDVAMLAGYSDQAHFVREFRRFAGVTPGRWR